MAHTHKLIDGVRVDLTADEITAIQAEETAWNNGAFDRAMANLRRERNNKLAETDFYALSDVSMSEEMIQYRKDLRDITEGLTTVEQVEAVEFPSKP